MSSFHPTEVPPPRYTVGLTVDAWDGTRWVSGKIVVATRRTRGSPVACYHLEVPDEWDWICVRDGAIRLYRALEVRYA